MRLPLIHGPSPKYNSNGQGFTNRRLFVRPWDLFKIRYVPWNMYHELHNANMVTCTAGHV